MAVDWHRLYKDYDGRCAYCGRDLLTDLDTYMGGAADHIVPKKWGGPDAQPNLALSCAAGNNFKGQFNPQEGDSTKTKEQLIERARTRIFEERSNKVNEFMGYLKEFRKVKPMDEANGPTAK
jgi:CRISPR/Cas system Type II protein with McrA/HNH and RuvC-like nuclease domain